MFPSSIKFPKLRFLVFNCSLLGHSTLSRISPSSVRNPSSSIISTKPSFLGVQGRPPLRPPMRSQVGAPMGSQVRTPVNSQLQSRSQVWKRDSVSQSNNTQQKKSNNNSTYQRNKNTYHRVDQICKFWLSGNCKYGDDGCKYLHRWFDCSDGCFSLMAQIKGHTKAINGIGLPLESDKLWSSTSGTKDESIRVWDCNSGECCHVLGLGGPVSCMINHDVRIFIGIPGAVKAWNTRTNTEHTLKAESGQIYSMVEFGNGLLFAGLQSGSILVWNYNDAIAGPTSPHLSPSATLTGHTGAVISLAIAMSTKPNKMYSGSMDTSIRIWDMNTLQCIQTVQEHSQAVMSLLCWGHYLISCSLDKTIKVWSLSAETGNLEVTYTHKESHGLLALNGIQDAHNQPILLCSSNDNTVRFYDLPSFQERGKIFSKEEIRTIRVGPQGLFFTGDATGDLKVWKVSESIA